MVAILMWRPRGLYRGDKPMMILSGDPPRSRVLSVLLLVIIAALALAPFLFPGAQGDERRDQDLHLRGAGGVLRPAARLYRHRLVRPHDVLRHRQLRASRIALYSLGPTWTAVAIGLVIGLPLAALLALVIGLFSLRVRGDLLRDDHAGGRVRVPGAGLATVGLTGGEDGRSFQLPELLRPGTVLISKDVFGFDINGRMLTYYLVFFGCAAMFLSLLRVVNSPFGRVLQAIRENQFRAEALGYRTVFHLTWANCLAALVAASAGALNALWLRYAGPDTSLSFAIMIDILLMVVIGGMGTMYGAVIGATIFILAQNYLQALMGAASSGGRAGLPMLPGCCIPTAGCCGLACCSSPASISSRPASSAGCARGWAPQCIGPDAVRILSAPRAA